MSNIKKKLVLILVTVLSVVAILGGCSKKEVTVNNEQTLNIKVYQAGYGVDWLYELESKFEEAFASEGYNVNILEPSPDYSHGTIINEMSQGYDNTGVDLYITGLDIDSLGINGTFKKVLAEEVDEIVYNQPAIKFDGTNEDKLVKEKISEDVMPYMTDSAGKVYGFNWVQSAAGLAVNTKKLAKYYAEGKYELPRTTNELFDCIDKIALGSNGQKSMAESGTKPVTYFSGQNGYQNCMLMVWLKQYDADFYDDFWSMEKDGQRMLENGYEVFNNPAIIDMLTNAYRFIDPTIAAKGSATQTLDQAQAKIMKDKDGAVFYAVGDWFINEVKLNYKNELNDVEFINFPVTSALGTKLFGSSTSYNFDDAKCDSLLSAIIKLVDENKSIEEISSALSTDYGVIKTEDLETVAQARGVFYSRGTEACAVITKDALGKDVAAKFLRMMASDDFASVFSDTANVTTPFTSSENTATKYKFVNQASKIAVNRYKSLITHKATSLRKDINILGVLPNFGHIPQQIAMLTDANLVSIYNFDGTRNGKDLSVYVNEATKLQQDEYNALKNAWNDTLSRFGIEK